MGGAIKLMENKLLELALQEIWNSDKIYPTKARPRTLFVRKTQSYLEYSSIKCYHIIA